jgi:succinate-semialdehyde dehydrogenase/glutarate-semialdehyde dehydrogenase
VAVTDPANGAEVARVPAFGAAETEMAIAAADRAFSEWSAMTGRQRGVMLRNWARLIEAHAGDLALILTAEEGKPLAEGRAEVLSAASYFSFFADEAERVGGEIIQAPRRDSRIFVQYRPIGVVAAITPWNFPSSMVARKLAPALAAAARWCSSRLPRRR